MPGSYRSRHHGVLGTVLDLHLLADNEAKSAAAEQSVLNEVRRLERVFSVFDPTSDLSRWKRGEIEPGAELSAVLRESLFWHDRSGGAYNPETGALSALWDRSARENRVPSSVDLETVVRVIAGSGYTVDSHGAIETTRRLEFLDLNAIAKGWIVDRVCAHALDLDGVAGVMLNAGGDLLNLGEKPVIVGIEDPVRPYDNVPPTARVRVNSGFALATSGGARRGWRIGERWFSHVIDPRSGHPVRHVQSASVLAPSATEADVVATILSVLDPDEGLAFVEDQSLVGCLLQTSDGRRHRNQRWLDSEIS